MTVASIKQEYSQKDHICEIVCECAGAWWEKKDLPDLQYKLTIQDIKNSTIHVICNLIGCISPPAARTAHQPTMDALFELVEQLAPPPTPAYSFFSDSISAALFVDAELAGAVCASDAMRVRALLDAGVDVNGIVGLNNVTALMVATELRNAKMVGRCRARCRTALLCWPCAATTRQLCTRCSRTAPT